MLNGQMMGQCGDMLEMLILCASWDMLYVKNMWEILGTFHLHNEELKNPQELLMESAQQWQSVEVLFLQMVNILLAISNLLWS
jgi:hypothetical protein